MERTSTSNRLKQIMSERNLRQVDILEKSKPFQKEFGVKMGRSALSQYVSGKSKPDDKKLTLLSRTLDVSEAWLMGYDVDKDRTSVNKHNTDDKQIISIYNELKAPRQQKVLNYADNQLKEQKLEEKNQNTVNEPQVTYYIYDYYDQPASAGTGQYLNDVQVEQIELPIEVDADFVVPIYGDSMEPEYHSGDYVFVKLSVDLSSGDIGVFEYYGDAYIKELVINDSGAYLHSLNPKYDDILIDADSDFRIIGEVVGKYSEK